MSDKLLKKWKKIIEEEGEEALDVAGDVMRILASVQPCHKDITDEDIKLGIKESLTWNKRVFKKTREVVHDQMKDFRDGEERLFGKRSLFGYLKEGKDEHKEKVDKLETCQDVDERKKD